MWATKANLLEAHLNINHEPEETTRWQTPTIFRKRGPEMYYKQGPNPSNSWENSRTEAEETANFFSHPVRLSFVTFWRDGLLQQPPDLVAPLSMVPDVDGTPLCNSSGGGPEL